MKDKYDILIIGGGMVGASLACALGKSGLRIGIVEAVPIKTPSQPGDNGARTVALAYGSKRIFDGMGVWSEIQQRGAAPIKRIHISDRGRFGFTRLDARDAGIEALGYVVENRVLGTVLYEAMQGLKNVRLFCPAAMEAVAFKPDAAVVTVKCNGAVSTMTARLVVAADGADSAVRAAVGIKAQRVDYGQTAIVTTVVTEKPHGNTAYERFTETGPLALLPMDATRCAVVWSTRPQEVDSILSWDDAEFLRRLQERFGDRLGAFREAGKRQAYPLFLTRVKEHVRPRLALIGNAAHTVHPVAGQGFNLGLRDVAALSEVLVEAARAGRDVGDAQVLQRYADWRRRDNRVVAGFTGGLIRIFSNTFPPLAVARNLGLITVDLAPPVKRYLVRITSGLSGRLPKLARGLPL